jgi:hypothetical protein
MVGCRSIFDDRTVTELWLTDRYRAGTPLKRAKTLAVRGRCSGREDRLTHGGQPDSPAAKPPFGDRGGIAKASISKSFHWKFVERDDIAPAVKALKDRADALYVCAEPLSVINRVHIGALALEARLPTMYGIREGVEAGGLMSYGASFSDQFRHAAELVDKILRGTKPGDFPVEQPTKFELIINLTTAKALGLSIPQTLLATADEVIG